MTTLKVTGNRDLRPEPSDLGRGLPPESVVLKDAVVASTTRSGGLEVRLEDLDPDDVVEIELQDGLRVWSRVEDVARDFAPPAGRGAETDTGAVAIPPMLTIGPASRGAGGWAIKALKVLGLDLEGKIAGSVATYVEGKLQPGPGLYRCSEEAAGDLRPLQPPGGKGPTLVLLHGTASSTEGSFAGLWAPSPGSPIRELFRQYQGRVLAYQHQTLTASPIANALDLATRLAAFMAPESELHIVSHSRGGLIGELLARGMRQGAAPFTLDDFKLFEDDAREEDHRDLEALSRVLQETHFRITRFVRVACPARGTTLADRRLDRYFTVLVNLAALIPALKASPVYDALTSLLAGVLKKRTDPRELPGLEAMMPTSPLVRMLNNPDVVSGADLHVLGGDLAGVGLFGRLKTLVTDFYYRDDHDLVVNTPAMLGGMERAGKIKYWIDTGDKVTHFHYFARTDTSRRLVGALTGTAEFRELEARPSVVTGAGYVKRGLLSRPVVVVLPGTMGSQLSVGDRPIWMNILELARGGLSLLGRDAREVKATGLFNDGYAELCKHLGQTHEVERFPYDWRRPVTESAALLRDRLEELLPDAVRSNQPIRLLAHSMGGLVVRAMLADQAGRDLWRRACEAHPGSRFIMLGTPNGGSHAISALLIGRDPLVKKLALVDLKSDHSGLLSTIAGFDGVLNLLPHGGSHDLFDRAVWQQLLELDAPQARGLFGSGVASSKSAGFRWSLPSLQGLAKARELASVIRNSPLDPSRVVYVAGTAPATASDLVMDKDAPPGRRVRVMASVRGDGRVLWATGIPNGIQTFYMDTVHGDLANDRRHFPAIVELLETGKTTRLPTVPPASRAGEADFELPDPEPAMVPDEPELVADALGGRRVKDQVGPSVSRVSIRVVNDNLTNARSPVLASHYRNDVIVAAEEYLDRELNGRLSELLRMELYPGPIGTAVVVLNEEKERDLSIHPGAIIAGLGVVGDLTPGSLTATLTNALTLYGAECVGRARRKQQRLDGGSVQGGEVPAPVTALLIGSGEGGVTLSDSVTALLRAVRQANQRLSDAARESVDGTATNKLTARIDHVEIFELYQDRAIEALYELRDLSQSPEFESFTVEPFVVRNPEGQRRARYDQAKAWWQRIRVRGGEQGALEFEAVTRSARAAARLLPTQRDLVDGFVQDAIRTTANDPSLGQTLFELLVPNDFKAYAPDRRKLELMLSADAAAIPWELMLDGFDRVTQPLSVSSGMIRQLLLTDGREHVLRAPEKTALVIGDPVVTDTRFPPLPGAAAEAGTVDGLLQGAGFEVQRLVGKEARPKPVLAALHEKPWRILHLAAHGVFEFVPAPSKAPVTGLVLDGGVFFGAADADQMRYVPDIVFINCCHLGQTRGDASPRTAFHRLAANLATQFIKMGARAVVAAGWEVNDAAAKTFATTFYKEMLQGTLFGDAVIKARQDVYFGHGETNTWGAYQCYGEVSYSLPIPEENVRKQRSGRPAFVCDVELAIALETFAARARQPRGSPSLLTELEPYLEEEPAAWWRSAEVRARAGEALEALGEFERAMEQYQRVLTTEPAAAPIYTIERLANCKVRRAGQLVERDRKKATQLLDEAAATLNNLLKLGETAERYSLLGGVMKRRFMLSKSATDLHEMRDAYRNAHDLARKDRNGDLAYPLGNQLAADIALSWSNGHGKGATEELLGRVREYEDQASVVAGSETDTFKLLARADHKLLEALARGELDEKTTTAILREFTDAKSRGVTSRQQDSIMTQIRFFLAAVEAGMPEPKRARVSGQLEQLEEALGNGKDDKEQGETKEEKRKGTRERAKGAAPKASGNGRGKRRGGTHRR